MELCKGFVGHLTYQIRILYAYLDSSNSVQVAANGVWPAANWDPAGQPPSILIGIVSSDVRLAMRSLRDYLAALHLPFVAPTSRVSNVMTCLFSWNLPYFIRGVA